MVDLIRMLVFVMVRVGKAVSSAEGSVVGSAVGSIHSTGYRRRSICLFYGLVGTDCPKY